jgi:hypothetical protein
VPIQDRSFALAAPFRATTVRAVCHRMRTRSSVEDLVWMSVGTDSFRLRLPWYFGLTVPAGVSCDIGQKERVCAVLGEWPN